MKHIFSLSLCLILLVSVLTGCAASTEHQTQQDAETYTEVAFAGFENVGFVKEIGAIGESFREMDAQSCIWCYYLREKITNVMYVWRTSGKTCTTDGYSYWSSGMTVLMNPDTGGPLLYADWLDMLALGRGQCSGCNQLFNENAPNFCPDCGSAVISAKENKNG